MRAPSSSDDGEPRNRQSSITIKFLDKFNRDRMPVEHIDRRGEFVLDPTVLRLDRGVGPSFVGVVLWPRGASRPVGHH